MDPVRLASPDAVRDLVNAQKGFARAIRFDHENGVSANEIADMVAPVLSRPPLLAYLAAERLRSDVVAALKNAGVAGLGAGVTGVMGARSRRVYVTLTVDPREVDGDATTLYGALTAALAAERIHVDPDADDGAAQRLWDGEELPVRRMK